MESGERELNEFLKILDAQIYQESQSDMKQNQEVTIPITIASGSNYQPS